MNEIFFQVIFFLYFENRLKELFVLVLKFVFKSKVQYDIEIKRVELRGFMLNFIGGIISGRKK